VGLSSILTSSSSLGGVTGRGKPPNGGLCVSAVLELVPKAKIPELDVSWLGSPNCGTVGFSGEVGGGPNLKVNEKAGFVSFGASLRATAGDLADSPGDVMGVEFSGVNDFWPSVKLVAPNPANDVPDELPNENTGVVDPFRSGLVATELGSIVEAVEGVGMLVGSGAEIRDGRPPNKVSGG
jgi:hypothetical protein